MQRFGKFCIRVGVGLVVAGLFGGTDALTVIFALVVCTLGLGLIVVLPGLYLIGLLCTIWFLPIGRSTASAGTQPPPANPATTLTAVEGGSTLTRRRQVALADFLAGCVQRGYRWEEVETMLDRSGWSAHERALAHSMYQKGTA